MKKASTTFGSGAHLHRVGDLQQRRRGGNVWEARAAAVRVSPRCRPQESNTEWNIVMESVIGFLLSGLWKHCDDLTVS
jgi:hypothetical protein